MYVANPFIHKNKASYFDRSMDTAPNHFPESNNEAIQYASVPTHLPKRKQRPKRARQPQKPGKTANNQERQFVVHNYHDRAMSPQPMPECLSREIHRSELSFPRKLHLVLREAGAEGLSQVISWSIHGRCFLIHQPKLFTQLIMLKYFRQTKLTSFQRQLNLYGFQRITRGRDAGGYYHEFFLQSRPELCNFMTRVRVKGTRYKAASNPLQEPNFYAMPFASLNIRTVPVLPIPNKFSSISYYASPPPSGDHFNMDGTVLPNSAIDSIIYPLPSTSCLDSQAGLQPISINDFVCAAGSVSSMCIDETGEEISVFATDDKMDDILFQEKLNTDDTLASMIEKLLEEG